MIQIASEQKQNVLDNAMMTECHPTGITHSGQKRTYQYYGSLSCTMHAYTSTYSSCTYTDMTFVEDKPRIHRVRREIIEVLMLTEPSLRKIWDSPEEDAAWADL